MNDLPPLPWAEYAPGSINQDLFTIPLQGGLLFFMQQYYLKSARPLKPFSHEDNFKDRNPTRHSRSFLAYWGGTSTIVGYSYFTFMNDNFPVYEMLSGLAHTHLLTETITLGSKNIFQRKRPFYNSEQKKLDEGIPGATIRDDDRASFFSGHASHSMAWANYMGLLTRQELGSNAISWVVSGGLWGLGAWVGAARAIDGQHHWSDVLTGTIVGWSVSQFVFARVINVTLKNSEKLSFSLGNSGFYPACSLPTLNVQWTF